MATNARTRGLRMSDELYDALVVLADRNGRTIAEECRIALETWVRMTGNVDVTEARRPYTPHPNLRDRNYMTQERAT